MFAFKCLICALYFSPLVFQKLNCWPNCSDVTSNGLKLAGKTGRIFLLGCIFKAKINCNSKESRHLTVKKPALATIATIFLGEMYP